MANIKQVTLPSGSTYYLVDVNGRNMLASEYSAGVAYSAGDYVQYNDNFYRITADISAASNTGWSVVTKTQTTIGGELKSIKSTITSGIHFRGYTTTILTDGSTTNPIIINGSSYTVESGDLVIYDDQEFLFDGTKWNEFGSTGTLKAMAFADTASGSANVSTTVSGTAAAQTFTGTAATINVTGSTSGVDVSITPTASDKVSLTPFGSGGSFTQGSDNFTQGEDTFSAGSLPSFTQGSDNFNAGTPGQTYSVANEILTITNGTAATFSQGIDTFGAGSLPSFTQGADSFTQGSDSFTPASGGTAVEALKSIPTPVVTQGTVSASGSYTPAGTNSSSSVNGSGTGTVNITVTPDNE